MRLTVGSLALGIVLGFFPPASQADVVVSTSLDLTQLKITSTSGSLTLSAVTASAFASVFDSLGGADAQFDGGPTTASVAVATSLVSANGAADAGALTASASSSVNIPGISAEAGTNAVGPYGDLAGSFEIVDSSGMANPVSVNFSAVLNGSQSLFTDASGLSATSETIFSLLVFGPSGSTTELFLDNPLAIGPSASLANSVNQTLSNSDTLLTNTPYSFDAQVDAESDGLNATPEPSFMVLTGLACIILFACRSRRVARRA